MPLPKTVWLVSAVLPAWVTAQSSAAFNSIRVVDNAGQPIPFASVSVKGGIPRVANSDGVMLLHLGADTVKLLARRMGFEPFQGKVGRSANRGAFQITLGRSAQALTKVVVNERRGTEEAAK